MLIRISLLVPARLRRRLTRLAPPPPSVVVTSIDPRPDRWRELARQTSDLIVIDRSLLRAPVAAQIRMMRDLPDSPDIVVVTNREDPEERASLLAEGTMAVLHEGISDTSFAETLAALVQRRRETALATLSRGESAAQRFRLTDFASASSSMQALMAVVRRVVTSDSSLLILGETGVGKEWLARAIHYEGPRAQGPFNSVTCGALPESLLESELFGHEEGAFTGAVRAHRGYFELAHCGTIFLDEIADMPLHLQVKLLRALQERRIQRLGSEIPVEVDVRIMAATNRDLHEDMRLKRFRPDLFYRLGVVTLTLPPLRERREDIPTLLDSYLEHFRGRLNSRVVGISEEAREAFVRYHWPGNVRELVNVMERAVLLASGEWITPGDLPDTLLKAPGAGEEPRIPPPRGAPDDPGELLAKPLPAARRRVVDAFEEWYLTQWLRRTGGRIGLTARHAGIDPRSLFEKMRRLGIRKEDFRLEPSEDSPPPAGLRRDAPRPESPAETQATAVESMVNRR